MPLDLGAHVDGNCIIVDDVLVVLGKDDPRRADGNHVLLMPHFATCPKRKEKKDARPA